MANNDINPKQSIEIKGSEKPSPQGDKLATINHNESIEITVRVRRKKSIEPILDHAKTYSHQEYEKEFGASQEDIDLIEKFASQHHLSVAQINYARRTVLLKGQMKYFEEAFQIQLDNYQHSNGTVFRGREGTVQIPAHLENIIEGVFGLDNRPVARRRSESLKMNREDSNLDALYGYTPVEIANAYNFPKNVTGKGQCIGIIELGGGYRNEDLVDYFAALNLPMPEIKSVSVGEGINNPTNADSDDGEVVLDIEVAGAIAPGAKIVVYFADNTDKGFLDAITTAIHDTINKPTVISISWGYPENIWTSQSLMSFNEAFKAASLLGITICTSVGDHGSADQMTNNKFYDGLAKVDFPASSPFVLACGGTKIDINDGKIVSEVVWNDGNNWATGGGVSEFFIKPQYQSATNIPLSVEKKFSGRGLPDVAANACPVSGYKVLIDGKWDVLGGTSSVAPLMAGFFALSNEKNNVNAGFINPILYANPTPFCRNITTGDNITTLSKKGYTASDGWNACTGWGVMNDFTPESVKLMGDIHDIFKKAKE